MEKEMTLEKREDVWRRDDLFHGNDKLCNCIK